MKCEQLQGEFKRLCRELESRPEVLHSEFVDGKKECAFFMLLYAIRVELVYSWKWDALAAPSVLFCRFYLNKGDGLFVHLPELLSWLNAGDYRACYFPYIETPRRMECCFRALMEIVDAYIPAAEELVRSGQAENLMQQWLQSDFFDDGEEPNTKWDYNDPEDRKLREELERDFESVMVGRHTDLDAYHAFLLGNWDRALKKYRKMEKHGLSAYEQGLCRFMEDPKNRGFQPMPPECFALPDYRAFQSAKNDLLGIGLLWVPCSVLLCGIIAAVNGVLGRGTLFHFAMPAWFGTVLGIGPALFGYHAVFQPYILDWLRKKKDLEFYSMLDHHPTTNKIAVSFFGAIVLLSLGFCISTPQICDRFYDSYAICTREDDSSFRFGYDEITQIYYIRGRYNDNGDLVKRGSYVIVLRDGTCVDLDGNATEEEQEELVEALFSDFQVIYVDSDRDLPGELQ